jgi:NADH-quinone oxidoreductase subunit J
MIQSAFYFFAFVSIFFALLVVISKNVVHSALYLILTFFSIAAQYILLNAQFLFVVQVIVYAGAIMVLFLYALITHNLSSISEPQKSAGSRFAAVIAGGALLLVLVAALRTTIQSAPAAGVSNDLGMVKNLGKILYTDYIMPFEVASVLFLIAMVGAVVLGKREPKTTEYWILDSEQTSEQKKNKT